MRPFLLILIIIVLFYEGLFASVSGRVFNETGAPIPFPQVENLASQEWVTGDEQGYFYLPAKLTEGDKVAFHRIGYQSDTLQIEKDVRFLQVRLKSQLIVLAELAVVGQRIGKPTEIAHFSINSGAISAGESSRHIQNYLPGITLKQYGGPGSVSTLSMDGGNSQNLTIVYGAIELNSIRNGSVDFSQLPFSGIDEIAYFPAALYGESARSVDGVLRLSGHPQQTQLQLSVGAYGHRSASLALNFPFEKVQLSVRTGYRADRGDYLYQPWRDENWRRRENNHYRQLFGSLDAAGIISRQLWWRMTLLATDQSRGVPGLSWGLRDTLSYRDDQLSLAGAEFGWLSRLGDGKIAVSVRYNQEYYENRNYFIFSDSREIAEQITLSHRFPSLLKIQPALSYQWQKSHLRSGATGKHKEIHQKANLSLAIPLTAHISLKPALFANVAADSLWYVTWQSELQGHWLQERLKLIFLAGSVQRQPTLNDRYWQPGGNPRLKPERTKIWQLLAQYESHSGALAFLQIFSKASENLIQWVPQAAYWSPANIQKALRRGIKGGVGIIWDEGHLLQFSYSYLDTEDRALKKALRYAPKHQFRLNGALQWHSLMLKSSLFQQSSRIFMYNYPEDIADTGLMTIDGELIWRHLGKWTQQRVSISVNNVFDNRYESVPGYPEPGREWRITLTIKEKGVK
jgi:vitamin B12 transporter